MMTQPFNFKNARLRRVFGQNFLRNPRVVARIIHEAQLTGRELVLEVGPGFGILTEALLATGCRVIAIEKDRELYAVMKERFKNIISGSSRDGKFTLIHDDALKIPPPQEPYIWVSNIPYSITSPLLDHFIRDAACSEKPNLPLRAVLMVQKEVAEKICAAPPRMNVLALHVQAFGKPKIVARVSRHNFKPAPKVDSAIISIEFPRKRESIIPETEKTRFARLFSLIHTAFSQKRKMLRATLPEKLLQKAGIDGRRRPETLSLEEWKKL